MKKIQKIAPKPIAKFLGAFYVIIGFIAGIFISIAAYFDPEVPEGSKLFALLSFIWFPILYGLLGLLCGYLGALLYNVIAKKVGPLEIELVD
jgi:ABC-type uncharacterized transport system permease subunit